MHDALTGIPNRVLLLDRLALALERAERDETLVGVLYIDLDRFKDVNDSLRPRHRRRAAGRGRPSGSTATLRPGDTVARVGGDEFAVVAEALDGARGGAGAGRAARCACWPTRRRALPGAQHRHRRAPGRRLRRRRDARRRHGAVPREGVGPRPGRAVRRRDAGAACSTACRPRPTCGGRSSGASSTVYYQPIVDLARRHGRGARGPRPLAAPDARPDPARRRSSRSPRRPARSSSSARFVIARACADAARWNATCPTRRRSRVTVNLSARQLADAGLPDFIATSARRVGHRRRASSALEITETRRCSTTTPSTPRASLRELRALGVRLLLDDFGTGYSSLALPPRGSRSTCSSSTARSSPASARTRRHGDRRRDPSSWPARSGWPSSPRASRPREQLDVAAGASAASTRRATTSHGR